VVSGNLYVDQITVSANLSVTNILGVFSGSTEFVFPARHWAFTLDGHATLAVGDVVLKSVSLLGMIAGIPTPGVFEVTAELVSSGQSVYDDWSPT
jgi:hypothetical protein